MSQKRHASSAIANVEPWPDPEGWNVDCYIFAMYIPKNKTPTPEVGNTIHLFETDEGPEGSTRTVILEKRYGLDLTTPTEETDA
jgi:hypothetical protein